MLDRRKGERRGAGAIFFFIPLCFCSAPSVFSVVNTLRKQCFDKGVGVEFGDICGLFAQTNKFDRDI